MGSTTQMKIGTNVDDIFSDFYFYDVLFDNSSVKFAYSIEYQ